MSTNLHTSGNNASLQEFINACVSAGSIGSRTYPDQSVMQYVKAAIANNAGTGVAGAPSLEVAQMVIAALGA